MNLKTYRADSMKEALTRVRRDFGADAVIVATRQVRKRRLFGLRTRSLVEVTASDTMPPAPAVADARPSMRAYASTSSDSAAASAIPASLSPSIDHRLEPRPWEIEHSSIQGPLQQVVSVLPSAVLGPYSQLIADDMPEFLARRLMHTVAHSLAPDRLDQPEQVRATLLQAVEECIHVAPPIQIVTGTRRVVALVGPTGAGKTTTLAKLAATLKLEHGVRLGLLTLDTYRIAAVEELRTYSQIIGAPFAAASQPSDLPRALDELGMVDLVFIDTAGCSPRDAPKIRDLAEFLLPVRPDEIHLVLSAVSSQQHLRAAVEQFATVAVNRMILTKLDEAAGLGGILGLLVLPHQPLSYVTSGQAVPEDIESVDRTRLARLILRQEVPDSNED
jgi:flagellar biosynthesis protein FlhF